MKKILSLLIFTLSMLFIAGGVYIGIVYALNSWDTGYQVTSGQVKDITLQDTSCRRITNNATNRFIPTRTMAEWNSFNAVAASQGVTVASCGTNGACGSAHGTNLPNTPVCGFHNFPASCYGQTTGAMTCNTPANIGGLQFCGGNIVAICECVTTNPPPTTTRCAAGTPSAVTGGGQYSPLFSTSGYYTGPYSWSCEGIGGGTTAYCSTAGSMSTAACGARYFTENEIPATNYRYGLCNIGADDGSGIRDGSYCGGFNSWRCANGTSPSSVVMCYAACTTLRAPFPNGTCTLGFTCPGGSAKAVGTPCETGYSYSVGSNRYGQLCQ